MDIRPHAEINRRNLLKTASAFALMPLLNGCGTKEPFILAGHKWPGYESLFMARDLGWLPLENMYLFDVPNASVSMQALREGKAQAAMLTLDEMIRLCSEGLDLRVVLVFNISLGADVVLGRPEIKTHQDLVGKTIGYEDSALGALMLHEFLNHVMLDKSEINPVHVTFDQHKAVWDSGQLDALITFEPNGVKLMKEGAKKLFDSRQMPDKIFDVLVVTADAAKRYKSTINELIRVHFKALHHFRSNPMDAHHRIAKRLTGIDVEDIMQVYRGLLMPDVLANHAYLSKQDPRMSDAAEHLIHIMRDAGIILSDCDLQTIFTNEFIPRDLI